MRRNGPFSGGQPDYNYEDEEEHKNMISRLDLTTNTTESLKQGAGGDAQNRPNESWEMIESYNGKIIERNMEDSEDSDEVPDEMDESPAGGHQGRISVGP